MRIPPLAGVSILLVDDDDDFRDVFDIALTEEGASVHTAPDGEAALTLFEAHRSDVVLTDITMPRRDGEWLLRQIRALPDTARVRVLAVTGHGSDQDIANSKAVGFDGHLVKPIDIDTLIEVVATVRVHR